MKYTRLLKVGSFIFSGSIELPYATPCYTIITMITTDMKKEVQ
jgi:hypothetical protein